jgi:3'-phosphoadenosine 5'-phosphosulfate sulfotransferase (PAPS reductase)/FAD synthetase
MNTTTTRPARSLPTVEAATEILGTLPAIGELGNDDGFASYDVILASTSGGKDSQAMLYALCMEADRVGYPRSQIVAVHADLGQVEWAGTGELARKQAEMLGLRFIVVQKGGADFLGRVLERFAKLPLVPSWPSPKQRWCTSDLKRGPIRSAMTTLVDELRPRGKAGNLSVACTDCGAEAGAACEKASRGQIKMLAMRGFHKARKVAAQARPQVRILNAMGLRSGESVARSKLTPFEFDKGSSNSLRHVDAYMPIHAWTADQVWSAIAESGLPHHRAYDLGMPRLSCVFCIFSPTAALMLAGEHNPKALDAFVAVEKATGYGFKIDGTTLESIRDRLAAGERQTARITTWEDCGK